MTPLYDALCAYVGKNRISFHTPGHKGRVDWLSLPIGFDLTELTETGSLYEGGDAIERAEQAAAEAFGAGQTFFSAGGCTLCIQTMLCLARSRGRDIVMARNAHRSAVHAAALLDMRPYWLTECSPEAVQAALKATHARTVYLTSPDYYGNTANIREVAEICHKSGAALLVDNAHGSHLGAYGLHPLELGADITADSWHKTLPVLTGGAVMHMAKDGAFSSFSPRTVKQTMARFGSTSPSFIVLLSLDLAREWWQREGKAAFAALPGRLAGVRASVEAAGMTAFPKNRRDPARITLDCGEKDALAAADRLRECGVEPEYADARYVVLLPSPLQTDADFSALSAAVLRLAKAGLPPAKPCVFSAGLTSRLPRREMSLREAVMCPGETVAVSASAGRIAAEAVCPCPPGVAAVVPGERITPQLAAWLQGAGIGEIAVVG